MSCEEFKTIESDVTTQFTDALAQDVKEDEDIAIPADWLTCTINKMKVINVSIQSKQNLEWDLILWSKSAKDNIALNTDNYIIKLNFPVASGRQIAAANQFYYEQTNLIPIAYNDDSNQSKIHCSIVNRSIAAKNAGATGQIKVRFVASPGI